MLFRIMLQRLLSARKLPTRPSTSSRDRENWLKQSAVFLSESGSRAIACRYRGRARRRLRAGTAITFQRGLNLTIAMVHAEHSDKLPG